MVFRNFECVASQALQVVGGLHLDPSDFERLVPSRERPAQDTRRGLIPLRKFCLRFLNASHSEPSNTAEDGKQEGKLQDPTFRTQTSYHHSITH